MYLILVEKCFNITVTYIILVNPVIISVGLRQMSTRREGKNTKSCSSNIISDIQQLNLIHLTKTTIMVWCNLLVRRTYIFLSNDGYRHLIYLIILVYI